MKIAERIFNIHGRTNGFSFNAENDIAARVSARAFIVSAVVNTVVVRVAEVCVKVAEFINQGHCKTVTV